MHKPIPADGNSSQPSANGLGISFQSPSNTPDQLTDYRVVIPSLPRRPPRKSNRPSTAPAKEDLILLPSDPPPNSRPSERSFTSTQQNMFPFTTSDSNTNRPSHLHPVMEDDMDSPQNNVTLSSLSPSFEVSAENISSSSLGDLRGIPNFSDCDWATFINAYASGRWDPRRTPNPPRSFYLLDSYRYLPSESSRNSSKDSDPLDVSTASCSSPVVPVLDIMPPQEISQAIPEGQGVNTATMDRSSSQPATSMPVPPALKFHSLRPVIPMNLSMPSHRLRNSFSSSSSSDLYTPGISNAEVQTTVATMRWAAARVDISPLALPSPEHELTDPMRGVTAAVPGSHPPVVHHNDYIITPGGSRKSRLMDFWQGTMDIDEGSDNKDSGKGNHDRTRLATIVGSPSEGVEGIDGGPDIKGGASPSSRSTQPAGENCASGISDPATHLALLASVPPATAPAKNAYHSTPVIRDDYFGDIVMGNPESADGEAASETSVEERKAESAPAAPKLASRNSAPLPDPRTVSVPALPRRVGMTRQTSSPLPISVPHEARFLGGRVATEPFTPSKGGRAAKEEQMFSDLGYLAPPYPPDELERRRALYKFNIWNTGPDLNFDRIAHLAKLVFSTRGVVISLIDGNEQWFKSEWGIKTASLARIHSFCGHSILQRGDEPMVVLDSLLDWRFAKNPLVTGTPNVRFYAGAPLRTQDGFNIGTLAVIDDTPRDDFTPRQRHTLKEFAAIAMREMELWRDKIQLRIRDRIQNSMEQFSRECLEIDTEVHAHERPDLVVGSSMDRVYDRAAKLVKRTLDVEGVIVMDVSHCEVLESMSAEGTVSVTMHHGDPQMDMTKRLLTTEEYHQLNSFFAKHPDGKISEGIIPPSFRPFLPTHIQYALTVPIFNIDKRPFALLCAYNANDHSKRFLEGHELSYLRAIGVIILSAVLKRRMMLADKAKSLFISNISHELRTPLHGILAAAELLSESQLNHSQFSFLQTVQACGTSLVETVNHVLDFTKLSGNSKSGGVENVITPTKVDLMQLIEEAVDGCWIGHRARTAIMGDSGIGSVYSPPKEDNGSPTATRRKHVETVVDVGYRPEGWVLKCEKGGIRRVLMNLFGNSLKFTLDGFVHVILRQLPSTADDPSNKVKIELTVYDTGKGISQNFLKNQLFHPFSQENPLQAGTGLGLAIVSSIVTSESVSGKVDVWSEEGAGTEIKVTFLADLLDDSPSDLLDAETLKPDENTDLPTVSLLGFGIAHRGVQLLDQVLRTYLTKWWGFKIVSGPELGDIVIVNEDTAPVVAATERRDTTHPFIVLSTARGSPIVMSIASEYERIGGFCRILYKPGGPSRLRAILKLCLHALKIGSKSSAQDTDGIQQPMTIDDRDRIPRRNSEESHTWSYSKNPLRPAMTPRSTTANPVLASWRVLPSTLESIESTDSPDPDTLVPTITVGSGGTLLKSSIGSVDTSERRFRVLVVEDNSILRNLLIKWLSNKGYDFRDAVDGRDGVNIYSKEGPFDVVLLDLSMPVLDGIAATAEIREIESSRAQSSDGPWSARILALTGMSSLEDKRRAFEAGVDGYLVKPVAFKTLDEMFHRLRIS